LLRHSRTAGATSGSTTTNDARFKKKDHDGMSLVTASHPDNKATVTPRPKATGVGSSNGLPLGGPSASSNQIFLISS
jgi:hypothetical protein